MPANAVPEELVTLTTSGNPSGVPTSPTCPFPLTMVMADGEFEPVPVESDPPHAAARTAMPTVNKEAARDRPTNMELPPKEFATLCPLDDD